MLDFPVYVAFWGQHFYQSGRLLAELVSVSKFVRPMSGVVLYLMNQPLPMNRDNQLGN